MTLYTQECGWRYFVTCNWAASWCFARLAQREEFDVQQMTWCGLPPFALDMASSADGYLRERDQRSLTAELLFHDRKDGVRLLQPA